MDIKEKITTRFYIKKLFHTNSSIMTTLITVNEIPGHNSLWFVDRKRRGEATSHVHASV